MGSAGADVLQRVVVPAEIGLDAIPLEERLDAGGDVGRGAWATAAVHLVLAAALVAGLWAAWTHVLGRRLVEPVGGAGGSATVGRGGWVERLYPADAATRALLARD